MELKENRLRKAGLMFLLAIVAVAIAWFSTQWQGDGIAATQCRQLYAQAKWARDSAAVDRQRPIVSGQQATAAASCGMLRREGRLER